jgi:hypothetical protein
MSGLTHADALAWLDEHKLLADGRIVLTHGELQMVEKAVGTGTRHAFASRLAHEGKPFDDISDHRLDVLYMDAISEAIEAACHAAEGVGRQDRPDRRKGGVS